MLLGIRLCDGLEFLQVFTDILFPRHYFVQEG